MKKAVVDFFNNEINLKQLKDVCGTNLHSIKTDFTIEVRASNVAGVIKRYLHKQISLQDLVDWVNVVWFTDLFDYAPEEEDSIASVMSELETMDEEGVCFSEKQLSEMIYCLMQNREY